MCTQAGGALHRGLMQWTTVSRHVEGIVQPRLGRLVISVMVALTGQQSFSQLLVQFLQIGAQNLRMPNQVGDC